MPIAFRAIVHGRAIGGLKAEFTNRPHDVPHVVGVPLTAAKIVSIAVANQARGRPMTRSRHPSPHLVSDLGLS